MTAVSIWDGLQSNGALGTFGTNSNRCRCISKGTTQAAINDLVARVSGLDLQIAMTANLRHYDGKAAYTLAQGQ